MRRCGRGAVAAPTNNKGGVPSVLGLPRPYMKGLGPGEATDRRIDRLVYGLYDLTEEEIEIVEGATS